MHPLQFDNKLSECDPIGQKVLDEIRAPQLTLHEAFVNYSSLQLSEFQTRQRLSLEGHARALAEKRAARVMSFVLSMNLTACIGEGKFSETVVANAVPDFDRGNVRLLPSEDTTEVMMAATLKSIGKGVQLVLDEICARCNSVVKIKMHQDASVTQNGLKTFVYMKYTVDFSELARAAGITATATIKTRRTSGQKRRRKRVDPVVSTASTSTVTSGRRARTAPQRYSPDDIESIVDDIEDDDDDEDDTDDEDFDE